MVGPIQKLKEKLTHHGDKHHTETVGHHGHHTVGDNLGTTQTAGVAGQPVAYGYTETVVGTVPAETVAAPASTGYTGTSGEAVVREHVGEQVCSVREYAEVEDRPVLKERVERVIEHNPVEKRYVVETRPVGETLLAERSHVESVGVTERVIDRAEGQVCPTATTAVPAGATVTNSYNACADGSCNRI